MPNQRDRVRMTEAEVAEMLAANRKVQLATINPDGYPHLVTMYYTLVDGNIAPPVTCAVKTVVKGDALSFSIAAASVVAKVTRDRIMRALAPRYPGYGWETNVGYATQKHGEAIRRLGITRHHRRSFEPVRLALEGEMPLFAALVATSSEELAASAESA